MMQVAVVSSFKLYVSFKPILRFESNTGILLKITDLNYCIKFQGKLLRIDQNIVFRGLACSEIFFQKQTVDKNWTWAKEKKSKISKISKVSKENK